MLRNLKFLFTLTFVFSYLSLLADDSLQSLIKENIAAIKTSDTTRIVKSYVYLGDYLSDLSEYEKSNAYLTKGLEIAKLSNKIRQCGTIYNILATNASYSGNRPLAFSFYHKALKSFADIRDLDKVAMVLMNIGSEHEFAGD